MLTFHRMLLSYFVRPDNMKMAKKKKKPTLDSLEPQKPKKPKLQADPLAYEEPKGKVDKRRPRIEMPADRKKLILRWVAEGADQRTAAAAAGLSMSALMQYKANHPDYALRLNQAAAMRTLSMHRHLVGMAESAIQESVKLKALTFWLSHKSPDFRGENIDEDQLEPDQSFL